MTHASPHRPPLAVCTIVSRNYLAYARALAQSYAEHEPGGRFYLLVVDELPEGTVPVPGVRLLRPAELALPRFQEMCFEYNVTELCTAVKPTLLLHLFEHFGEEQVVYLDPDILILRPLEELRRPLAEASIVLTPHLLKPIPRDGKRPDERDFLIAGAYNLGFIGLRKTDQALSFLGWWQERLHNGGAVVDVAKGLMTDQKWADLVPGLFPDTAVLQDETYNVAWWNLCYRELSRRGGPFLVNGRPLAFFHFSGFDPARPGTLTKECQDRTQVVPGTALAELLGLYAGLVLQHGHAECSRWGYGFSRFDNGVPINVPLRRAYLGLDGETRRPFGDPFRATESPSFLDWATRPQPEEGNLSPFLLSVYQARSDLWRGFPDIRGQDRESFVQWAVAYGAGEMGFDLEQMKVREALPSQAPVEEDRPPDESLEAEEHGLPLGDGLRFGDPPERAEHPAHEGNGLPLGHDLRRIRAPHFPKIVRQVLRKLRCWR
jgi:hypothetical protein